MGQVIRAPFAGWALAHSGSTRGGNWVTVVGIKGYVQNDHLSRFGHIGQVKFGTIIGYVGMTGDAAVTHDHFEWHPWVLPKPLHKAPSGFSLTTDAIDPYPFLNKVCSR
jgi:murein DD-endopeptidase MepM/ murein hydrolase activator NlpD